MHAVELTPTECEVLAVRLVAKNMAENPDWLSHEDVPRLDLDSFFLLADAVEGVVKVLHEHLRQRENVTGIDSAYLSERIR